MPVTGTRALSSGVTRTALSQDNLATRAKQEGVSLEEMERRRAEVIPLKRANDPEDIAAMVALLASDEGRFVSGQILRVDGGVSKAFAHVADNRDQFEAHVANIWGGAA